MSLLILTSNGVVEGRGRQRNASCCGVGLLVKRAHIRLAPSDTAGEASERAQLRWRSGRGDALHGLLRGCVAFGVLLLPSLVAACIFLRVSWTIALRFQSCHSRGWCAVPVRLREAAEPNSVFHAAAEALVLVPDYPARCRLPASVYSDVFGGEQRNAGEWAW